MEIIPDRDNAKTQEFLGVFSRSPSRFIYKATNWESGEEVEKCSFSASVNRTGKLILSGFDTDFYFPGDGVGGDFIDRTWLDCPTAQGSSAQVVDLTNRPEAGLAATLDIEGQLRVTSRASEWLLKVDLKQPMYAQLHASLNADIVAISEPTQLLVVDLQTRKVIRTEPLAHAVVRMDTAPSSRRLLLTDAGGVIKEINLMNGITREFSHRSHRTSALTPQNIVNGARYASGDRYIVYVASDGTLNKIDTRTGSMVELLLTNSTADAIGRRLFLIEISRTNRFVLAVSDQTVFVYDLEEANEICAYRVDGARKIKAALFGWREDLILVSADVEDRRAGETILLDAQLCSRLGAVLPFSPKVLQPTLDGSAAAYLRDGEVGVLHLPFTLDRAVSPDEVLNLLRQYDTPRTASAH